MKLYHSPGACSLSPHIVLHEIGIAFDAVRVDLKTHRTERGDDFHAITDRGRVPVLELDDGQRLTEGTAIVQYLADLHPQAGLVPAPGTFERSRLQEWLGFLTSDVHQSFSPLFDPTLPAAARDAMTARVRNRLDTLERRLGKTPYLLGDRYSVADAYAFTLLSWAKPCGLSLADWPALASYSKRVFTRPAVQAAMRAEGLVAPLAA